MRRKREREAEGRRKSQAENAPTSSGAHAMVQFPWAFELAHVWRVLVGHTNHIINYTVTSLIVQYEGCGRDEPHNCASPR